MIWNLGDNSDGKGSIELHVLVLRGVDNGPRATILPYSTRIFSMIQNISIYFSSQHRIPFAFIKNTKIEVK